MKSIILLGDSVLARESQDQTTALLPRLSRVFSSIQVLSYAKGGATSTQAVDSLKQAPRPSDALVIISIGMNDAAPWKQVPLRDFIANYETLLKWCTPNQAILVTPYPVDTRKQRPPGRDNAVIEDYAKAVVELAKVQQAGVVNLYKLVDDKMKDTDLHVADGVHLNDAGYTLFFDALQLVIKRLQAA